MKTLVVHIGGIGDFILACPAIQRLAEDGPVYLLGRPDRLKLAVATGLAVAAHDLSSVGFESILAGEPSSKVRGFLSQFQRVIIWMRDAADIRAAIASCGVPDVRAFPGLPPEDWANHASLYFLSCIGENDVRNFRLNISPDATRPDVVIQPGSGAKRKNWPRENFALLTETLRRRGREVYWLLGPAEEDMAVPDIVKTIVTEDLVEVARPLAGARLYIGNDSGITHLAAAVACPTVAIFGPTDPHVWGPRGERVRIVAGKPWPDLYAVLAAAKLLLNES